MSTSTDQRTITINPVTRIEGHVTDTRFHVVEFRGFE